MTVDFTIRPARIEAAVYRAPIAEPARAAFAAMTNRPMLLVEVTDERGGFGWGEVWCNFPPGGAEHRAGLIKSIIAPLIEGESFASPEAALAHMDRRTQVMALQTGEPGPIAQAIAGIDQAIWDLIARRAGLPLWKLLGGTVGEVRPYASGLGPDGVAARAAMKQAEGYRAFKLKVGFGRARDLENIMALRGAVDRDARVMIDANQAWDLPTALDMARAMVEFRLDWLEEPLRVDAPAADWLTLAQASAIPLAGGENMRGAHQFSAAIAAGALQVIQPDLGKWGGFSGCRGVAREAVAAGRRYCPHWLGGGIGILASAHLLAATGGGGMQEIDAQDNPLRAALRPGLPAVVDGVMRLPDSPGLGVEPNLAAIEPFRIAL